MSETLVCHTLLCKLIEVEKQGIKQSRRIQKFYFIFGALIIILSVISFIKPDFFPIVKDNDIMEKITGGFGLLMTGLGIYSTQTISSRAKQVIKLEVKAKVFESPTREELEKRKQECDDIIKEIKL